MTVPALYPSLKDIKLTIVRQTISADSYRRSMWQTFGWCAFDLALYLAFMWAIFASDT